LGRNEAFKVVEEPSDRVAWPIVWLGRNGDPRVTRTKVPMRDPVSGVWKVTTQTSVYVIDLNQMTATRLPGEGMARTDGPPSVSTSGVNLALQPVPLLVFPRLRVGERAILWLDIKRNGLVTSRMTTVVRALEPLDKP
jgi:hypothetical protein